jgi:hypothetical protein
MGISCTEMPDGVVYTRPQLLPISKEAIPAALAKVERYRFLNEPLQAESICRDVLAADPTSTAARVLLILSLTDQFEHGINTKEALQQVELLPAAYQRAYYSGIVYERHAIALFRRHEDHRSRREVYRLFQIAMDSYRQAKEIRPPDNDDSVLRWNACVRFLERNWGFQ